MVLEDSPDFERFLAFVNLEEPDRVPLAELLADLDIMRVMVGKDRLDLEDYVKFYVKAGMDYVRVLADGRELFYNPRLLKQKERTYRYSLYSEEVTRAWAPEHEGLVKTEEDLERILSFDVSQIHASTAEELRRLLDRKYPKMGLMAGFGDVFTTTWMLRGFTQFCVDLYRNRGLIRRIYEKVSEVALHECKVLVEAGVDAVWPSDDIAHIDGLLVSPRDLKEFFFPWLREVGRIAKKNSLPMIYHSDGDLTSVMEDLIDCGVDAIHPIEPKAMNIVEVKEKWGDRLALIGNIDLGYTLTLGTVDDVVREVKERIRDLAPGGGYAVGTSNTVTDYVKLENYKAMIAATKKWGRYPIRLR